MTMTAHRIVAKRHHMEGVRKQALEMGRSRLLLTGMVFTVAFAGIAGLVKGIGAVNKFSNDNLCATKS